MTMDKKINQSIDTLKEVATKFREAGFITEEKERLTHKKLEGERQALLKIDKKYDKLEARRKMGLEPNMAYA